MAAAIEAFPASSVEVGTWTEPTLPRPASTDYPLLGSYLSHIGLNVAIAERLADPG